MIDLEPRPIHCAGCGARLGDQLGDLVVVRIHARSGQSRRVVARDAEITCVCGLTWCSVNPSF